MNAIGGEAAVDIETVAYLVIDPRHEIAKVTPKPYNEICASPEAPPIASGSCISCGELLSASPRT
jgi:hypothetical protein